MSEEDLKLEVIRLAMRENTYTLIAACVIVTGLALVTKSIGSLWGLLILLNLNTINTSNKQEVKTTSD